MSSLALRFHDGKKDNFGLMNDYDALGTIHNCQNSRIESNRYFKLADSVRVELGLDDDDVE